MSLEWPSLPESGVALSFVTGLWGLGLEKAVPPGQQYDSEELFISDLKWTWENSTQTSLLLTRMFWLQLPHSYRVRRLSHFSILGSTFGNRCQILYPMRMPPSPSYSIFTWSGSQASSPTSSPLIGIDWKLRLGHWCSWLSVDPPRGSDDCKSRTRQCRESTSELDLSAAPRFSSDQETASVFLSKNWLFREASRVLTAMKTGEGCFSLCFLKARGSFLMDNVVSW